MLPISLRHDRRSAVALLFAIMAVPIIGLVGLAIDFGYWNQTYASLELAASGAALNAVKTTSAAALANVPYAEAVQEGQQAGAQWFVAQVGTTANMARLNISTADVSVQITPNLSTQTTATVTYSSNNAGTYVGSIFGKLFGIGQYPLNVVAAATVGTAPYLDVEILLDNSPSMEIGATANDIASMMAMTACSQYGAWTLYDIANTIPPPAGQAFWEYQYKPGYTNDSNSPELRYPFGSGDGGITGVPGASPLKQSDTGALGGPPCQPHSTTGPLAGPPCAFACHFDTNPGDLPGTTGDYFAIARSTINQSNPRCYDTTTPDSTSPFSCQITLRFDLLKSAVNQTISMMQTDDLPIDNLKVGIFSFGQDVTQVYPATGCGAPGSEACQAGDDWGTASNLVGSYPTKANEPEPGIQPIVSYNFGQTDFNTVMTNLANQYLTTPSGSGTQPDSPAKVLFLVTDGMGDVGTGGARAYGPLLTSLCDTFKKSPQNGGLGYTIYVVYTPYYSLMNSFYITNIAQYTEPVDTSPVAANLAACSSDPTNDFVITNPNDPYAITKALQRFLTIALNSAARFTQ